MVNARRVGGHTERRLCSSASPAARIANLETRLVRWMVGTVIATATLTVGILRLIG